MSLCSGKDNLTVRMALLDYPVGNLYYRNDKGLPDGVYFRYFAESNFGRKYDEIIKYCEFILVDSVGIYHKENDSYSGGYGLVEQSKVDTFARFVNYDLKGDKFYFSPCSSSFSYFATQTIERKINNINSLEYLFNFLIPSIGFNSLLISSLIFYFTFLFLITKFNLITKFISKLLSLFFIIFLFFIHNLYNSNLNTSNVIVNTSDLLNNIDDITKTNRELCVFEKSSAENDFFFSAPKNSLANELNKKINHNNLCYLSDTDESNLLGNILTKDQNKIFIFTFDIGKDFILKMIQTVFKKDLFISSKSIYENLKSLIMPKTISKQLRNLINNWIYNILENGVLFTRKNIPNLTNIQTVKFGEFTIYNGVQDYIKKYTIITAISLDKFNSFFKIYFGFLILLIFIFLIHHLINYSLNYLKYLIRNLRFYSIKYLF